MALWLWQANSAEIKRIAGSSCRGGRQVTFPCWQCALSSNKGTEQKQLIFGFPKNNWCSHCVHHLFIKN